jgi:2-hydroxychromene-2-carboxylate isomerase
VPRLEFFFDVSSPWTYLAFENVQPMARALGVEIAWRPILVGGVFNAVNPSVYASRDNPVPAKAAYMLKDLQDWARSAGLKIVFPPRVFPVNSVKAMRACLWVEPQGRLVALARALFAAYWGEDRDISQDAVLAECASAAGLDPAAMARGIAEPAVKERLRANTDELIARGGFGSPTLFVDGADMYFGNDRLELVRVALARAESA